MLIRGLIVEANLGRANYEHLDARSSRRPADTGNPSGALKLPCYPRTKTYRLSSGAADDLAIELGERDGMATSVTALAEDYDGSRQRV